MAWLPLLSTAHPVFSPSGGRFHFLLFQVLSLSKSPTYASYLTIGHLVFIKPITMTNACTGSLRGQEEGIRTPGAGVTGGYKPTDMVLGMELGPP